MKMNKVMVYISENINISCCQYLGVTLEETGKDQTEINSKIEKANKRYYALNRSLVNKIKITQATTCPSIWMLISDSVEVRKE